MKTEELYKKLDENHEFLLKELKKINNLNPQIAFLVIGIIFGLLISMGTIWFQDYSNEQGIRLSTPNVSIEFYDYSPYEDTLENHFDLNIKSLNQNGASVDKLIFEFRLDGELTNLSYSERRQGNCDIKIIESSEDPQFEVIFHQKIRVQCNDFMPGETYYSEIEYIPYRKTKILPCLEKYNTSRCYTDFSWMSIPNYEDYTAYWNYNGIFQITRRCFSMMNLNYVTLTDSLEEWGTTSKIRNITEEDYQNCLENINV